MAIPIIREPREHTARFRVQEACCFCHQDTVYWTDVHDRTPGQQVACCSECADIFDAGVVPSKDEWWDYHSSEQAKEGR